MEYALKEEEEGNYYCFYWYYTLAVEWKACDGKLGVFLRTMKVIYIGLIFPRVLVPAYPGCP